MTQPKLEIQRSGLYRFFNAWFAGGEGQQFSPNIVTTVQAADDNWMLLRDQEWHFVQRLIGAPAAGRHAGVILTAGLTPIVVMDVGIGSSGTDTREILTTATPASITLAAVVTVTSLMGSLGLGQGATIQEVEIETAQLPTGERLRDPALGLYQPFSNFEPGAGIELKPSQGMILFNRTEADVLEYYVRWRELPQ